MRMAVCPTRSLPPNAIAWLAALPPGKTKPHPQGTLPWSAPVQVFGRRHHERRLLLRRPASKKRQGTTSRDVGERLASARYGDFRLARSSLVGATLGRRDLDACTQGRARA